MENAKYIVRCESNEKRSLQPLNNELLPPEEFLFLPCNLFRIIHFQPALNKTSSHLYFLLLPGVTLG